MQRCLQRVLQFLWDFVYTYDSPKNMYYVRKNFIFSTIVLSVEMGSSDKRPNIFRGVDLSIFSG